MVVDDFNGKTVFLDTAPLIYFFEGAGESKLILQEIFENNDKGLFNFITSSLTLLEVLVKPIRDGKQDLVNRYQSALTGAAGINIYDLNINICLEAANLRARFNFRTPDALQIATAKTYGADYFFTNDSRLKAITEIQVVTLADLVSGKF